MLTIAVYIINTLIVLISGVIRKTRLYYGDRGRTINGQNVYLWINFLLFTMIMGARSVTVGVDTAPYSRIYNIIGNAGSYIEALRIAPLSAPLYILICWLLHYISANPQTLVIFTSVFVNAGLFLFIKRASPDMVLSTFCWIGLTLFNFSMNGNRQSMAIVLVLNALVYLSENISDRRGWFFFIAAIGIHSTCLISVIAILGIIMTNKLKDNKLIFTVTLIGSLFFSLIFSQAVILFMKVFPRYNMYGMGNAKYSIFENISGGRIILLYIFLLLVCVAWLITNKKSDINTEAFHSRMLPGVLFCAVFGIINSKNILINRMLWFYIAIYISFIPSAIAKYRGILNIFMRIMILVILFSYSVISLMENQNGIVPYLTFWYRG